MSKSSITWNGREVHNVWLRALVALAAVLMAVVSIVCVALFVAVVMVTCPVWLPLDRALKHFGRSGFIQMTGRRLSVGFTPEAFGRRPMEAA